MAKRERTYEGKITSKEAGRRGGRATASRGTPRPPVPRTRDGVDHEHLRVVGESLRLRRLLKRLTRSGTRYPHIVRP